MKHKMFLTVAALVLLFFSAFKTEAQVGFSELDPNILWVADCEETIHFTDQYLMKSIPTHKNFKSEVEFIIPERLTNGIRPLATGE